MPFLLKAIGIDIPIWLGWLGVLPGSIISINIVGFNLIFLVRKIQKQLYPK